MNCTEAQDVMLVAEPRELRGEGDADLAAHVRECESCRAAARAVVSADIVIGAALVRRRARRASKVLLAAAVPIAAAIVVAVMLQIRATRAQFVPSHVAERPDTIVSVHVQPGQQATVIKTADPNVTIVWLQAGD